MAALAGIGLSSLFAGASAVATVIGTISSANAASASAEYNAKVQDRDAFVADQNRNATLNQARIDMEDKRRSDRRTLASIRASYGSSGIELAGSPLDVLMDTATEQETDTQRVGYEGQIRGREGALQALGMSEGANLSRMEAKSAKRGGFFGAVGAGLSGAGNILSRTY